ncbi:MAG: penicillin acylase family protein, partial [Pseudomonadota bacterium]
MKIDKGGLVVFLRWFSILLLMGCSTLFVGPVDKTEKQRLDAFPQKNWPISQPVSIYWHKNMIPFVEAQSDADGAFAIGVVHAHLRLGQMELLRRLSAGRLSEAAGPFVVPEIDQIIRTLNLEKSAQLSVARMSASEKEWLQRYVDGINYFIDHMQEEPVLFRFLDLEPEKWTMVDAIRSGRVAAADATWASLFQFLSLRNEVDWKPVWETFLQGGKESVTSFGQKDDLTLEHFLKKWSRSGSNSVVLHKDKMERGGAVIANDPHLGIFAPNLWVLMGYKTPSYHVLGYMLPGAPAVTVGRNRDIGFGGTYMRGLSSHLFEVGADEKVITREESIGRRWWFSKEVKIRETQKGPIITDLERFAQKDKKQIALSWMGHQGSNELGAFLKANRASDWKGFQKAFEDYAVAGLNLTYADSQGNIGMLAGIRQPLLKNQSEFYNLVKSSDNKILSAKRPTELPKAFNPREGFIASTNNRPVDIEPPIGLAFRGNDRILRLKQLARSKEKVKIDDIKEWQRDVFGKSSFELAQKIVSSTSGNHPYERYLEELTQWDGKYQIDSYGPVVFEMLAWQMALDLFPKMIPNEKIRGVLINSDNWRQRLLDELNKKTKGEINDLVILSFSQVEKHLEKFKNWGEMHVQVMQSPLGMVPYLGGRFKLFEYPADGGATTLNKSAFSAGFNKREVNFGAQTRHISLMSELNENYFVMLGGNDGWLN